MSARVDAHHHFLDPQRYRYPWMSSELAAIDRKFGPDDLHSQLSDNGIDLTVAVQTLSSEDETRDLLATAAATEFVAGVVGWVDLTSPSVDEAIVRLRSSPGGQFLVGIRHQVHDEPDEEWLLRRDVQSGLRAVGQAGLVYDLLIRPRELPAAIETIRRNPEMVFVVDHVAKPRIAAGVFDADWASSMASLGRFDNVACKLSGMVTEADWNTWRPTDLEPYIDHALDVFGPHRCLFGSDWPVCLLAGSYGRVVGALDLAIEDLGQAERQAIMGGTAVRVYNLLDRGGSRQGAAGSTSAS